MKSELTVRSFAEPVIQSTLTYGEYGIERAAPRGRGTGEKRERDWKGARIFDCSVEGLDFILLM